MFDPVVVETFVRVHAELVRDARGHGVQSALADSRRQPHAGLSAQMVNP
jgi:hypothetical protein